MTLFNLNTHRARLLADCIRIGFEGAAQNHAAVGGDNTDNDLLRIQELIEELDRITEGHVGAEIEVTAHELTAPAVEA